MSWKRNYFSGGRGSVQGMFAPLEWDGGEQGTGVFITLKSNRSEVYNNCNTVK